MAKMNLGAVTAYADAVAAGFEGSREEFADWLANAAKNAKEVADNLAESQSVLSESLLILGNTKTEIANEVAKAEISLNGIRDEKISDIRSAGAEEVNRIDEKANERLLDLEDVGAVRFDHQNLTLAQQEQARKNIGSASLENVDKLSEEIAESNAELKSDLSRNYVPYIIGTNLIDISDTKSVKSGWYISSTSGKKVLNDGYTSIIVPIDASKGSLSLNSIWSHIVFLSDYVDIGKVEVDEVVGNFISGLTGTSTVFENISIPSNATYVIVSISTVQLERAQLQYGTSCTAYEPFKQMIDGSKIKENSIHPNAIQTITNSLTVDINGSGDFVSLRECINYINNNNISDITIYILEGTYDIKSYYTDTEIASSSFIGLIIPRNVSLVGVGNKEDVVLAYIADKPSTAISTINFIENVNVKNMTIKGENIRYCVHDDYSTLETSHENGNRRNIDNVDFVGTDLTYAIPYGAGTHGNANWVFNNCRFINKSTPICFSVHDAVNPMKDGDYFEFNNCEFIGNGVNSIRLSPATSGFDSTIIFNGCKMQGIRIDSQFTGGNNATTVYHILGSGNSNDITLSYYSDHDKLSFPRFTEICKTGINATGASLSIGEYVKISNGTVVLGTSSDYDGVMFNACDAGEVAYVNISK
jgi:hypothetical protein